MKLSQLIEQLKACTPTARVLVDKSPVALSPGSLDSYRGYYEDLAIGAEAVVAPSPNWDAMTAEEIAAVIASAPVVLGEWEGYTVMFRELGGTPHVLVSEVPHEGWRWASIDAVIEGTAPTREAAMAAADAAARELGWRLMGGE